MIVLLLALTMCWHAGAQPTRPDLVFHHLTDKDGLSYNFVNCFLKDRQGMLWVGTYNGLNLYDGVHFYVFRKEGLNQGLPSNTVHRLTEDSAGKIWGATDEGIFSYDRATGRFRTYRTPRYKDFPGVYNIRCDRSGQIWATNVSGLLLLNSRADSFELVKGTDAFEPFETRKNGLAESPDGSGFWLATRTGLRFYDRRQHRYLQAGEGMDTVLFTPHASAALCATPYGHFWFMDNIRKRLVAFDPVKRKVIRVLQPPELGAASYGGTLYEDREHRLWLSTWNNEIFIFDYQHSQQAVRLRHQPDDPTTVAGDFFWDVLEQPDGALWLGTVGGISRCHLSSLFYKVHRLPGSVLQSPNTAIEFLTELPGTGTWWISTSTRMLLEYHPADGRSAVWDMTRMERNRSGDHPVHINRMLMNRGVQYLFSETGAWSRRGNGPFRPFSLPAPADTLVIRNAVFLNDSVMYCTDHRQVVQWNLHTGRLLFCRYRQELPALKDAPVYQLYITPAPDGSVWTLNGIDWITRIRGTEMQGVKCSDIRKDGGSGYYTAMCADAGGEIWMTKKADGLYRYHPATGAYQVYREYDGLLNDHLMALAPDRSGRIWTVSYNQFSVFNPLLGSFYNFTLPLSTNNYLYTNFMQPLSGGNIICNMAAHLVEFFPDRLRPARVSDQPLISQLRVDGREVLLPGSTTLALEPEENSVQIRFGMLTDRKLLQYDFYYRLEGAEENWTKAGANAEVSYNNLAPGSYVFRVKAVAGDKGWHSAETRLSFRIATPFYRSSWFLALAVLAGLMAVYAFYRYRLLQQRRLLELEHKTQMLEKEKAVVLYESLKQQLNPHFLFNSLASLSGLIETDQQLASSFLSRMSRLYRYILRSSEQETVPLRDELAFAALFVQLQQTRFGKGLQVSVDVPEAFMHYRVAPVTVQNLLENAIKHNIVDPESPLCIRITVEDRYLLVCNNLQRKLKVESSNGQGLRHLQSLYSFLSDRKVIIEETPDSFCIRLPLIETT